MSKAIATFAAIVAALTINIGAGPAAPAPGTHPPICLSSYPPNDIGCH